MRLKNVLMIELFVDIRVYYNISEGAYFEGGKINLDE